MFSLVSRCAGETAAQYRNRFHLRIVELAEKYPFAEHVPMLEGVGLFVAGVQVAYLSYRGLGA